MIDDIGNIARREKLHVVFEKPFIAAVNTHYLNALIRSTTHNRTNGGIHAGRVAAGGQYTDSLKCLCHKFHFLSIAAQLEMLNH